MIQRRIYKQAIENIAETIGVLDKEIELKDNKITFPADEMGIEDEQVIQKMENLNPTETLGKTHRVIKRIHNSYKTH